MQKPRRGEAWALALGVLILLGLFGHLWNQQRASRRPADSGGESQRQPSSAAPPAVDTNPQPVPQSPTPGASGKNNPETRRPSQVAYVVTHMHRLRDCHGTLTFTRAKLQFESDEPQDSFSVGLGDVTVDGDALRIRDKTWRFTFDDAIRAERVYQDWKTGALFKR